MASPSVELQGAILSALTGDPEVAAIVAGRVHDGKPEDQAFPAVTFGPSDYVPDDDAYGCVTGRVEAVQIDCWSRDGGRLHPTKRLADAVARALHRAEMPLDTHRVVEMRVGQVRVFLDPDGLTGHGVVTVEALVEEAA